MSATRWRSSSRVRVGPEPSASRATRTSSPPPWPSERTRPSTSSAASASCPQPRVRPVARFRDARLVDSLLRIPQPHEHDVRSRLPPKCPREPRLQRVGLAVGAARSGGAAPRGSAAAAGREPRGSPARPRRQGRRRQHVRGPAGERERRPRPCARRWRRATARIGPGLSATAAIATQLRRSPATRRARRSRPAGGARGSGRAPARVGRRALESGGAPHLRAPDEAELVARRGVLVPHRLAGGDLRVRHSHR